jgi:hypothetical protein
MAFLHSLPSSLFSINLFLPILAYSIISSLFKKKLLNATGFIIPSLAFTHYNLPYFPIAVSRICLIFPLLTLIVFSLSFTYCYLPLSSIFLNFSKLSSYFLPYFLISQLSLTIFNLLEIYFTFLYLMHRELRRYPQSSLFNIISGTQERVN